MSAGISYALVIGVENYNDAISFKRVRNAAKDAIDFAKALEDLDVDSANIHILTDGKATKTSIDKAIADIVRDVTEIDRIIFYFSGHGAFEGGNNYLLPVDCFNDALPNTSIAINNVLGFFTRFPSTRNLMFLDCCHSGLNPGTEEKDGARDFLVDMLKYNAREEEYTLIFASCKSHQTSFTHPTLPNSVWTHFLLRALTGETVNIYENGLLYHDQLQTYLNKETDNFIKLNTDHGKRQQPMLYGNVSDRFIIGDLNPILDEKAEAAASKAFSFTNISMVSMDSGKIKELPGFRSGFQGNKVPQQINSSTLLFVRKVGQPIIEDEISDLAKSIQSKLKYKLKDFKAYHGDGSGTISTPDFTYTMEIFQSENEPEQFILVRKLENIQSSSIIQNEDFNLIFASYFQRLEFSLENELNLVDFISSIEDKELETLTLDYDASNLTQCEINIEGLNTQIIVTPTTLSISNFYKTDPATLIQTYTDTRKIIIGYTELGLIH